MPYLEVLDHALDSGHREEGLLAIEEALQVAPYHLLHLKQDVQAAQRGAILSGRALTQQL